MFKSAMKIICQVIFCLMMAFLLYVVFRFLQLPLRTQGYGFLTVTAIATVADVLFGLLLSRTSGLAQLTSFCVDDYQNICDNAYDFQCRLLWVWIREKLAQILTGFCATIAINIDVQQRYECWIQYGIYLGSILQWFYLIYIILTYTERNGEIWALCKAARLKENAQRIEALRSHRS